MSGLLKRKFEEVEDEPCYSSSSSSAYSGWDSDSESCYSDTLDSVPSNPSSPATQFNTRSILKKAKRQRRGNVQFDQVTVFFFPRCQGFTSVPSRGGCSLGMVQRHSAQRRYTLAEFAIEQYHLRQEKVKNRMREEKLEALKQKLTKNGTQLSDEASQLTLDDIPDDDLDLSGFSVDGGSFLHPYPSKRRHAILKAAGVKKIDKEEKRELRELRVSREDCGCSCQGFCEPETCGCSLAGIKCQMDHSSFPCGCTRDGCGNREGRIEFNPSRVQTHYIHTIMKLELEKRLEEHAAEQRYASPAGQLPQGGSTEPSASAGENSCGGDTADSSSSSSSQRERSDVGKRLQRATSPLDVDEGALGQDLCLGSERTSATPSVGYSVFSSEQPANYDCSESNVHTPQNSFTTASPTTAMSELLDENANQDGLFYSEALPDTPSPSGEHMASYLDLSLSSESDLEFFDGFPCLGSGSLCYPLKDYERLDTLFQTQLPGCPSLPQASDPGTCLLESLIGLSESNPEPPATFTDNQMLEEAITLSVVEYVKV
ncbi:cysteine/serine-rich nuclear protein 1b isoform X1 [Electrophorus electricus]|uniref:cysteine/serine-rich nuclear protein 1b isoform X1 n=2 Tax=Electrophorus electricus TaxID=8005 RepID=UPI0015D027B4|nr:cysteine/serine-rich nuclear protein 1b isoform X1 [Electrophorus electricus]